MYVKRICLLAVLIAILCLARTSPCEPVECVIVNSGIRDTLGGSRGGWVRLANDFLIIEQVGMPQAGLHVLVLRSYLGEQLFTLNLNDWVLGRERLAGNYDVTVYFYDWRSATWRVWCGEELNETHGAPDFSHPAFKHVFRWRYCFEEDGDCAVNVTFYVTSWEPFVRVFVDKACEGTLKVSLKPHGVKRLGLIADYKDYKKHLLNWNQKDSKLRGNPWAPPAWSDCAQGFVGQNYLVEPSGVEMHKVTNYYQNLNRYVQGHAYNFFSWRHNPEEDWYSYEFCSTQRALRPLPSGVYVG